MQEGFIVLHRNLFNWEWYCDHNVTRLFIHLLLKVNHKDNKWQGHLIKRGQTITSYQTLATETNLSVRTIRTSINKLKMTGEVTSQTTNKFTILTVNNYDKWQTNDTQDDTQATNKRHASDTLPTTNNNDNNDNNENNINTKEVKKTYKDIILETLEEIHVEWKPIFEIWLNYKKERNQKYKSKDSALIAFKRLVELSSNDMVRARKIIEQSIANNWSGLFELKQMGGNYGKSKFEQSVEAGREFLAEYSSNKPS